MLTRRRFLTCAAAPAGAYALASVVPGFRRVAYAQRSIPDFRSHYDQLQPRITVGNSTGTALQMSEYVNLTQGIPQGLLDSFVQVISSFSPRTTRIASSDYIDFRYETAERNASLTRSEMATDVSVDQHTTTILTRAMSAQLEFGQVALSRDDIPLSVVRDALYLMRQQVELLKMEYERSDKGDAVYGETEGMVGLSGLGETEQLRAQIDQLKIKNRQLRLQNELLRNFVLQHG